MKGPLGRVPSLPTESHSECSIHRSPLSWRYFKNSPHLIRLEICWNVTVTL